MRPSAASPATLPAPPRFPLRPRRRRAAGGRVTLPVLFGFAMLAVDAGRYFNLHTSVQWAADALALAAAAELDRKPDAIIRANRAIDNLVANDQRFGNSAGRIDRRLLKARSSGLQRRHDGERRLRDDEPERGALRRDRRPAGPVQELLRRRGGDRRRPDPGARERVAGFDSVACNVAPLFTCNPYEGTSTIIFDAGKDPSFRRRLMAIKEKGEQYFPGNYGYLEPAERRAARTRCGRT